jgi:hypothetical protein
MGAMMAVMFRDGERKSSVHGVILAAQVTPRIHMCEKNEWQSTCVFALARTARYAQP